MKSLVFMDNEYIEYFNKKKHGKNREMFRAIQRRIHFKCLKEIKKTTTDANKKEFVGLTKETFNNIVNMLIE